MPLFGIDISRHQGTAIDWAKVRASGIDFAIARASLATTPDPTYRKNVQRARLAGIPVVGAYHFLYPADVVSPAEQARVFVERIQNADGLLTMLDVEKDHSAKTGQVFTPTISDVRAFAKEFARLTNGHTLIIYAPGWYWRGYIGNPKASDLGPLCASRYVHVDSKVDAHGHHHPVRMTPSHAYAKTNSSYWSAKHGGWTKATFLQFTSSGEVSGYGGRVDVDAFNGSLQKLRALTGPSGHPQSVLVPPVSRKPVPGGPAASTKTKRFHVVVAGETLSGIAARAGFHPTSRLPAFRVMLNKFAENARFRAHPNLIHIGDRVRVA